MQASAPAYPNDGDRALADRVLASRDELRGNLLQLAAPGERTLLLDVLADTLIDRFAEALADGTWTTLVSWADATCEARSGVPSVRAIFTAAVPAFTQSLGRDGFDDLDARLSAVAAKPRLVRSDLGADTIDELDVLLADMVGRVEANDPMTAEHCRAVSAWCARIAHRMSLNRTEATFVARGGLIHDVGKSVTPLEILQAPRKLTDAEWHVMRAHVLTGHQMIRDHHRLRDFSGVVRHHHERFDGRGYPDELDRTRIPIGVRIVSVADAFNAMIGRRPYRTPMPPDRAVEELKRNAGAQFDPNVVEALVDVIAIKRDGIVVAGGERC